MEKEIFFIGVRKTHSEKQGKDFYLVDYARLDDKIPKTDFIDLSEYNRIASKTTDKEFKKVTGIFSLNLYDKIYLSDIK